MMNVLVNNKEQTIKDGTELDVLLEKLSISSQGVAVALNQHVVKKTDWASTLLKEGDKITIIKATQGG